MRGKRARQLRKAAGGQELALHRKYGFVPVNPNQKNRSYAVESEKNEDGKRHYKLCPLRLMSEGRKRYKALKKSFRAVSRVA